MSAERTQISIKLDRLNPYHDWTKRGKRGIWLDLPDKTQILLELHKNHIDICDYGEGHTTRLYWSPNGWHDYKRNSV